MDITTKTYYGETFLTPGQISNTTLAAYDKSVTIYTTGADIVATSLVPDCMFNLTYKLQGPNLYQGAAGNYIWAGGPAFAFDNPESYVTGNITVGGKVINVVPEKSVAWIDWQWGNTYAADGWTGFIFLLSNGVKIITMTTKPSPKYLPVSISTLVFPDGHHEVHALDTDFHPWDPWVDPYTNITYYNNYLVNIPSRGIFLHSHLPVEGGQTTVRSDPTRLNSVADSYSTFEGVFDGVPVTGFGITERKENLPQS
ncbi:hypothetical protein K432DRAFT_409722 [Lepidopterella palustris CBS 459.81]|uniref:Uncharacterized protein n=1 Tax=Lepidopterella palustris CBS 459.81 TaxID=1314670 RepID=A0A8E2DZY4_9PEZI|nr:hypothetical protein K432DRAFT_409722 [Lepidopterella palustris CBS 459.81]